MIAIRFKTWLAAFALTACLAISHSSLAQECLKGDVNLDGTINMSDWLPMFDLLAAEGYLCEADIGDGQVDFNDIAGIQQILLAQQGPAFTNTVTDGVGDFFWSTSDLNNGAANGPIDLTLSPGESATLFLYYSTSGPSNSEIKSGYSINVATSQNGIVKFTQAETLNHPNLFGGKRWDYPVDNTGGQNGVVTAQAQSVTSDLVVGLTAMSAGLGGNAGISNAISGFDTGYDSGAYAFLCGKVQVEAIAPGTIQLAAGPNDLGIADQYALLPTAFTRANITVAGNAGFILGDVNLDGTANMLDINGFISAVATGNYQPEADCNQDTYVNFLDIPIFINILSGN